MTAVDGQNKPTDSPKIFIELKMTARCLFGAPDPAQNEQLVAKVHDTKRWGFERKWNFSIQNESQLAPNPPSESFYRWDESFENDYMAKCDSNRCLISKGRGDPTRVTLLSAPIILEELPEITEDSPGSLGMDVTDSKALPALPEFSSDRRNNPASVGKVTSRNPFTPSPSNSRSSRSSPNYERENSRSPPGDFLIFPSLKQRCITDYMKIKKIPPRMKKIRCRE
ncbi:unnamed protein product [Allacma fusca]|uniref:Uncharacterized protein n=1 Tax=Allacma fusca TaxID=39272 RepID=A0A8J2L162_9HEXA|nr:unnamed protein product [Allacma fusca]